MKKKLVLIIIMVCALTAASMFTTPLSAQTFAKGVTIYGGGGAAFSDYEGPIINLGFDLLFSNHFSMQLVMDFMLDPLPDLEELTGTSLSVLGTSIFGVYRFSSSRSFNVFVRGGLHLSTFKVKNNIDGVGFKSTESDIGVAGGLGFEFAVSERMGIILGADVKYIFDSVTDFTYYNVYGGVSYRFGGGGDY
ncbi:MAG: porin family protein [bacterium]|nr:porin family protein [bacterium]